MNAAPGARSLPSLTLAVALAAAAAACVRPVGEGSAPAAASPRPSRAPEVIVGPATGEHAGSGSPHADATPGSGGPARADATPGNGGPARVDATASNGGPARADAPPGNGGPTRVHPRADPGAAQAAEISATSSCASDAECGYDPTTERCAADPRLNRQPPLTDQGIVCYCTAGACALLRVLPVPCEGDHDCTVADEPRPHPARATPDRPRQRGRPCRDFTLSATCERTNICTLRRLTCPAR